MSKSLNLFSVNSFFRPIMFTPFSSNFNTILKLLYGLRGDSYLFYYLPGGIFPCLRDKGLDEREDVFDIYGY